MPLKTRQNLPFFVAFDPVDLNREIGFFESLLCLWSRKLFAIGLGLASARDFTLPLLRLPVALLFGLPFALLFRTAIPLLLGLPLTSLLRLLFGLGLMREKTGCLTRHLALSGLRLGPLDRLWFAALTRLRLPPGRTTLLLVILRLAPSPLVITAPVATVVISTAIAAAVVTIGLRAGDNILRNWGMRSQRSMHDMGMILHYRDLPGDQLLNIPQIFLFFLVAERKGRTAGAGSAGPAYTMYIGLRHIWQLEVDHMRQIIDVDTSCRDISCYKDAGVPAFEVLKSPLPGIL